MLGALDLLPKHEIARLIEIRDSAIEFASKTKGAWSIRVDGPIADHVLSVGTVARTLLRDHRHLMRVEGKRRLAALARIICKIDALPAIRAPELAHEEVFRSSVAATSCPQRRYFEIVPRMRKAVK
jgi:hypothetical protein